MQTSSSISYKLCPLRAISMEFIPRPCQSWRFLSHHSTLYGGLPEQYKPIQQHLFSLFLQCLHTVLRVKRMSAFCQRRPSLPLVPGRLQQGFWYLYPLQDLSWSLTQVWESQGFSAPASQENPQCALRFSWSPRGWWSFLSFQNKQAHHGSHQWYSYCWGNHGCSHVLSQLDVAIFLSPVIAWPQNGSVWRGYICLLNWCVRFRVRGRCSPLCLKEGGMEGSKKTKCMQIEIISMIWVLNEYKDWNFDMQKIISNTLLTRTFCPLPLVLTFLQLLVDKPCSVYY